MKPVTSTQKPYDADPLPLTPAQRAEANVIIQAGPQGPGPTSGQWSPPDLVRWEQGVLMEVYMKDAPCDPIRLKRIAEQLLPAYCASLAKTSPVDADDLLLAARERLYSNFEAGRFCFRTAASFRKYVYKQVNWCHLDLIRKFKNDHTVIEALAQRELLTAIVPELNLDFATYAFRLRMRLAQCEAHVSAERPALHCRWFIERYVGDMSNERIAQREQARPVPASKRKATVSVVSTEITRVCTAFCAEFLALGAEPPSDDSLLWEIYVLWTDGNPDLEISEGLAEALLRAAGLIGPGRGRRRGSRKESKQEDP